MAGAIAINCTLKKSSGEASSTDRMIGVLAEAFAKYEVEVAETLRMADYDILPGVTSDEGEGDDWPGLRAKILAHDIMIFGGPIWMGQVRWESACSNGWTPSCRRPTTRAGCRAMASRRA